jgi:predicted kinase
MDNDKQTLNILIGCSGAGKSTFATKYLKDYPTTIYLSSDQIRKNLTGDESSQHVNGQVFGIIKHEVDKNLKNGKSVMIDATSLNPKERRDYLDAARKYDVDAIAYVFERTKAQLMANQAKRGASGGRVVPEFVVDKMLAKYIRPTEGEGFKEIHLV